MMCKNHTTVQGLLLHTFHTRSLFPYHSLLRPQVPCVPMGYFIALLLIPLLTEPAHQLAPSTTCQLCSLKYDRQDYE